METPIYDPEELELLDFIENENPDSVQNRELEVQALKKSVSLSEQKKASQSTSFGN